MDHPGVVLSDHWPLRQMGFGVFVKKCLTFHFDRKWLLGDGFVEFIENI